MIYITGMLLNYNWPKQVDGHNNVFLEIFKIGPKPYFQPSISNAVNIFLVKLYLGLIHEMKATLM